MVSTYTLLATPTLYSDVLLDFPTECLPLPAIYPEHEDQPWVDVAAVGRWVARRLPGVQQLCFECRHSRTYNNPSFDPHVAMEITSQDLAALVGVMSPKLAGLRVEACDDMVDGALLGTLWCCSMLRTLGLHDLGYPLDVRRFNAGVRHLSQLEVLEVHSHAPEHGWGLEGFPAMLCTLPALRTLRLVNQRDVETLPGTISQLTSLQELLLRDCGIHGLPASLSALTGLTSLAIEGVSNLAAVSLELHDWLGALTNLAELSLKRSLLGCCPAEVAALGALRRLDVSHGKLAVLPVVLSRLTNLEELNMACNAFMALPEALSALECMRQLDLYGNCLGNGKCLLDGHLPPTLTWLDLSRNRLPAVPPAVSSCTALVHLALGGNKLHDLPAELGMLSMLEKLDVRKNCLTQVPAVLGMLRSLRHLILDGNPLVLDQAGAQALLSLPRLLKLSARVARHGLDAVALEVLPPSRVPETVPAHRQPQQRPQQQQPQGVALQPGSLAGRVAPQHPPPQQQAAAVQPHRRPQRQRQQPPQQPSPAAAAAGEGRAAQVRAWRQLAGRLAMTHGRTVLNVEGL
ncbi:hypothetical protein N2152v2_011103 [Parachlorella kessleri]